jgi:hypothetical protein
MGPCPQFTALAFVRSFCHRFFSEVSAPLAVWLAALSLTKGNQQREMERSLAVSFVNLFWEGNGADFSEEQQ